MGFDDAEVKRYTEHPVYLKLLGLLAKSSQVISRNMGKSVDSKFLGTQCLGSVAATACGVGTFLQEVKSSKEGFLLSNAHPARLLHMLGGIFFSPKDMTPDQVKAKVFEVGNEIFLLFFFSYSVLHDFFY